MNCGRSHTGWSTLPGALILAFVSFALPLTAQRDPQDLLLHDSAGSPLRFVSAKGQRAFVGGYSSDGLEFWAYPVQILRNYGVSFRRAGTTTFVDGRQLLSSVETTPEQTTRVYIGPGFEVRETLFVPVDRPAAIITYQVLGETPVDIEVRAIPVLDLMWPAGTGGQSVSWNEPLHAFILSEPALGFSAAIASPQISTHDRTGNDRRPIAGGELAFTLTPDQNRRAQLFVTLNQSRGSTVDASLKTLENDADSLQNEAASHWTALRASQLQLITPDLQLNRAFAWAETATEQAWVCNPDLGCGFVGGYGPSHATRRPQYDWFFAGDGLISAQAALDVGDWQHARHELDFILHYRDPKTGIIWHELSQSAGLIDWRGKYPYMFVHVDVTFQFLAAVGQYMRTTGDHEFLRDNWDALLAAYRYCAQTIDPATALPRIPSDKEGGNEQDRMADDLGLSVQWLEAAESFASLAEQHGNNDLASQARDTAHAARASISSRYWNADRQFWINGHTADGKSIDQLRSGPVEALDLFGDDRANILLDKLASADFVTDWGIRSLSSKSPEYDPESYAKGSVWPVATASVASAFWQHHRPLTAFEIWHSLLNVAELDAPGHLHEVLSGAIFTPQAESVPEQSWSSAGLLTSTVHGLLGLDLDLRAHHFAFSPNFPDDWDAVRISHLRVGTSTLSFAWHRTTNGLVLAIDNDGPPLAISFQPLLPLGASLGSVQLNGSAIAATLQNYAQETRAKIDLTVPNGHSELVAVYTNGIAITLPHEPLFAGDQSSGLRIINTRLDAKVLKIDADASCAHSSRILLRTSWKLTPSADVLLRPVAPNQFEATMSSSSCPAATYHHIHLEFGIQP